MTRIKLNGQNHELATKITIKKLLEELKVPPAGTAVAVNDNIITREFHDSHFLEEGDAVELIRAIGGG